MKGVRSFQQMLYSVHREHIAFVTNPSKQWCVELQQNFLNKTKFTALVVVSQCPLFFLSWLAWIEFVRLEIFEADLLNVLAVSFILCPLVQFNIWIQSRIMKDKIKWNILDLTPLIILGNCGPIVNMA